MQSAITKQQMTSVQVQTCKAMCRNADMAIACRQSVRWVGIRAGRGRPAPLIWVV